MTSQTLAQMNNRDESSAQVVALFERYASQTCAYLYSLVGNWETANDLNQDLYLRIFAVRKQLAEIENQRAWIYQIATRLALNEIKRHKRFAWLPWHWGDAEPKLHWTDSSEDVYVQSETVNQTLNRIPIDYRLPLILFSGHEFSIREIAETLQLSEGNVKVRLHRAREMFAKAYAEEQQER